MDESREKYDNYNLHYEAQNPRDDNYYPSFGNPNPSYDSYNARYDTHNPRYDNYNQGLNIYNQNVNNNELRGRQNRFTAENTKYGASSSSERSSNGTTSSSSGTISSSTSSASSSSSSEEGSNSSSSSSSGTYDSNTGSSEGSGGTTSSSSSSESSSASSNVTSSTSSSSELESSSSKGSSSSSGSGSCTYSSSSCTYSSSSSTYRDSSGGSKYSSSSYGSSSSESAESSTESKDSSTGNKHNIIGPTYVSIRSKYSSTGSEYSSTGSDPVGVPTEYIGCVCDYQYEALPVHYGSVPFASLGWSMSFSGCGFLGIYHLGVIHSLSTHGRKLLLNISRFGGASAGSLIASTLATRGFEPDIIEKATQFCYDLAEEARNKPMGVLSPTMSLLKPVRAFLTKILPEDCHLYATKRLYISVTELLTNQNHLICEFESKEHLIDCLLASSFIPYLTGKELITIGKKCFVDGGMTDNMPEIPGGRTILVAPFAGRQHICPVDVTTKRRFVHIHGEEFDMTVNNMKRAWHAFFPPSQEDLEKYYERGKRDCIRFLKKENFYENAAWPS